MIISYLLLSIMLVITGIHVGIYILAKYLYDNSKINSDLYLDIITNSEFLLKLFKHFIKNE